LNHRERFLDVISFKEVDRICDYEFGYWTETIDRWHREGLPMEKKTHRDIELYLGFEGWDCCEWLPIRSGLWPELPGRVIEEKEGRAIMDDGMGGIYVCTTESSSPSHYLRHPLKNREVIGAAANRLLRLAYALVRKQALYQAPQMLEAAV